MYHSLSLLPGRHGLVLGTKDDEDVISALRERALGPGREVDRKKTWPCRWTGTRRNVFQDAVDKREGALDSAGPQGAGGQVSTG